MTVDELQVLITANSDDLRKEIHKSQSDIVGLQKNVEKSSGNIFGSFKALATGVVALGIGKIIKDSVMNGVNAIETDNLFEVSMGKWADSTRSWSEEMQDALGLSAMELRRTTGVVYNMTTSMGLADKYALKMSKGISLLSNDMASFYNISQQDAFEKITAGITGETEPLKRLGILVDDNTIKQVAYSQGIATTGSELTQQQKVLARYVAILQQTGNAQGDLARTLDSPANLMRALQTQLKDLSVAFGNFFIPILSATLPYLSAFTRLLTYALNSLASFMGFKGGGNGAVSETQKISDNVGSVGSGLDSANKSAKKLQGTLSGFDEMSVINKPQTDTSGGGGGGAVGGDIGFNLDDYDAKLEWANNKTDKIVENIKQTFRSIGDVMKYVWNTTPVQAFAFGVTSYAKYLYDYWTTLGIDFYNNLQMTWSNIQGNVITTVTNIGSLWTQMWLDFGVAVQTYGQPIIDNVSGLFNSIWITAIDPYVQIMTKIWADFTGILLKLWNDNGKVLLDNIGQYVTNITALFQSIWDNVLEPIITPFLETMSWLWDKHIKGMVEQIGTFVSKLVNGALEIYNKFISPIVMWLLDKLSPAFAFISSLISGVMGTIVGVISDVISSVFKIFGGIIDFIVGVFTGNWSKAWQGVADIFGGIFNGIVGVLKGIVNIIIDVINGFVAGINKIKFDVPDWIPAIGGMQWGFNIPKIPKLAQGGVVDRPTYAMIGEAGKEAVMPLERNTGWIDQLASKLNSKAGNGQPIQIILKLGEDTIFNKLIDAINTKSFERNEVVFDL